MKKGLDKFIKVYMEILYALSSVFYAGFCPRSSSSHSAKHQSRAVWRLGHQTLPNGANRPVSGCSMLLSLQNANSFLTYFLQPAGSL